jgi:hypothetical protein
MEFIHSMNGKLFPPRGIGSAAFAKKLRQARKPSAEIFFVCFVFLVSLVDLVFLRKLEWLQILEMLTCYS